MPRFLVFLTFIVLLGATSPSQAAVYANGKFYLFSGLAHTAFQRLNVPFPGWVQPDFRPLAQNRAGFLTFLKEIRAFFVAPRTERPGNAQRQITQGGNENRGADISMNTILRLPLDGDATLGNTIDIFIGVNLKRILSQIFSTVFNLQDEFVIDARERQQGQTAGGMAGASGRENSNAGLFSTLGPTSPGGFRASSKNYFLEMEQTQFAEPPATFVEEQENTVRVWRRRIIETMTNPVAIFGLILTILLSLTWRIWRAAP